MQIYSRSINKCTEFNGFRKDIFHLNSELHNFRGQMPSHYLDTIIKGFKSNRSPKSGLNNNVNIALDSQQRTAVFNDPRIPELRV